MASLQAERMGVPRSIDGIQPFAELQEGSTTTVYKGYQSSLERFVLLKVLNPAFSQDEGIAHRFKEEARLVAKIQHPNVVTVYDYGKANDQVYLAAEYVDGTDLGQLLEAGKLPVEIAAFILLEAAQGIKAAHAQGILHRDLKPGNLMLSQEGRVKLTDFGMASLIDHEEDVEVRGTPAYMAPEQVAGRPPKEASDLFSLGAILYEMLAGRQAFRGHNTGQVLEAVLNHDPMPQLDLHAGVPGGLRRILQKLLAKDPSERYARSEDLIAALENFCKQHDLSVTGEALRTYLDDPHAYRKEGKSVSSSGLLVAKTIEEDVKTTAEAGALSRLSAHGPISRPLLFALVGLLLFGWGAYYFLDEASGDAVQRPVIEYRSDPAFPIDFGYQIDDSLRQVRSAGGERRSSEESQNNDTVNVDGVLDALASLAAGSTSTEQQQIAMGRLQVSSDPAAEVYVDGELLGTTPLNAPVPEGVHALALKKEGFPTYQAKVRVLSQQETQTDISLWSQVGRLLVEVPPGTQLYIDGQLRVTAPQENPFVLSPGQHDMTLQHPELGTKKHSFHLGAGAYDTLRFNDPERIGW